MDKASLAGSPIGQLVPISGHDARFGAFSCEAYLPAPLPNDQDLALTNRAWASVSHAAQALGRLDQAYSRLPNPGLLIRPALLREALDTSALEGTHGLLSELLETRLPDTGAVSEATVEIRAYVDAANHAFDVVRSRSLSVGALCEVQAEVFQRAADPPRDLGAVRKHQVWIGPEGRPITEARFVPPPGDDRLKSGLEELVAWIVGPSALPNVLRSALAHYQFETLHPFGDGNGRIGRLLVILQLMLGGDLREPGITLSPWLLPRRSEYQDQLFDVSATGEWSKWVSFFCDAIAQQSERSIDGADSLDRWLQDVESGIGARGWSGTIDSVVRDLADWPVTNPSKITRDHGVTPPTANSIINHLVDIGALTEISGRTYNRVFGATAVMEIVEAI